MGTDPARLEEIFGEAVTKADAAAREAYLDQACGDDTALRQRVEVLLAAHDATGNFLKLPHPDATADLSAPLSERPGTQIGPYKLMEQIGEGGFGLVFVAEQERPVRRKVALKVIKPGMDTREVIARFEAERQALAIMDHPNIARVFDAGATESGRPFFVMELVRGVAITDYCDHKRLTPRERLELFLAVCHAVQHAHHKGIIHRDIKPSNVLVTSHDGRPLVKVIDFGVAKAISGQLSEHTVYTRFAQMIGTPLYMSPEQAELSGVDIDTRTDIYSLGVLLYELLTGTTPFDRRRLSKAAIDEVRRIIREEEPPKPSTRLSESGDSLPSIAAQRHMEPARLPKLVRGELDWIVMKSLEKDRTRRYETANGLARDVERYLADEPVEASPPSTAYRLRKFARRNRTGLSIAALVLLFLILVGGGIGWAVRDRSFRQAALEQSVTAALDEVESLHRRENWPEAMASLKRAEGLLAAGAPTTELSQRVSQWRADLETVARLEEIALANSEDDAWQQESSAAGHKDYDRAFHSLGIDIDALTIEEAAGRIRALRITDQLTQALDQWAIYRRKIAQKLGEPEDWWQRPLAVARLADANQFRGRVRQAVEQSDVDSLASLARSPAARQLPGSTLRIMAHDLYWQGGGRHRDLALESLKAAQLDRPDNFWTNFTAAKYLSKIKPAHSAEALRYWTSALACRPQHARVRLFLANSLRDSGRLDEALAVYHNAIELQPDFAVAYNNIGTTLSDQGKLDEAVEALRKAIALQPDYAKPYGNLGVALRKLDKLDEAAAAHRKSIELEPDFGDGYSNLSVVLRDLGKLDEAVVMARKAVEIDPTDDVAHSNLGAALIDQGKFDEGVDAIRKALELNPRNATRHLNHCVALRDQGKLDDAVAACRKAIELSPQLALAHLHLGNVLSIQGKFDEAEAAFRRAIELTPDDANAYYYLGAALQEQGKLNAANDAYREGIRFKSDYACLHSHLGVVLRELGRLDEAIAEHRQAIEFWPVHADHFTDYAITLIQQGRQEEVAAIYDKAVGLRPDGPKFFNDLAWSLATAPDPKIRDSDRALKLAERAVEMAAGDGGTWNTLGVARCRARDWQNAVDALEKSMELRQGGDAFDWFFLAMAHWQLDHKDNARKWYDKSVEWMDKNQPENEELRRFRTEAAELLGIAEPAPSPDPATQP